MSEARIDRLETRLDGFEDRLRHIEEIVIRIDERLAATLPTLATKAELAEFKADASYRFAEIGKQIADKPSRLYLWGIIAAMTAAYTAGIAAIGVPLTYLIPQFLHCWT